MRLFKPITVELTHDTYIVREQKNIDKLKSKGYGFEISKGTYALMPYEVVYLLELNKIEVFENNEPLTYENLLKRDEINFDEYLVFKDLTKKGYQVRTGLKFGFTFRLYKRSRKYKKEHAPWLVYVTRENDVFSVKSLASLGRIAHSTKKRVILAMVDSEKSITYYEYEWAKI